MERRGAVASFRHSTSSEASIDPGVNLGPTEGEYVVLDLKISLFFGISISIHKMEPGASGSESGAALAKKEGPARVSRGCD